MISLKTRTFRLPLKHPFGISRGTASQSTSVVVEASCEGKAGYGEATVNKFYGATVENIVAAIERVRPIVELASPDAPAETAAAIAALLPDRAAGPGESFALCAIDEALHDLWGKRIGLPVFAAWGLEPAAAPPSSYTVGIDTIDAMVAKLHEEPGWPVYKIKLGTENDLEIVRRLRDETDAPFRIDANGSWGADQAIRLSHELLALDCEYIEQPLANDNLDAMQRVFNESALPTFADESCVCPRDVDKCYGRFTGINIKLMKCGGLAAAKEMIDNARRLGMQVMIGCMTESTIGISAAAQLLPLVDHADLDGAVLLAEDLAEGVKVVRGRCVRPNTPGTGVARSLL